MSPAIASAEIAGEDLRLHAQRGLYWPRARLLAIADLHLGKGDVFRRLGVAVPRGGTALDLQRIDLLLDAFAPTTLLVLGDLLHGPVHDAAHWIDEWRTWRERHATLAVHVVRGNHDRALSAPQLGLVDDGPRREQRPFLFVHDAPVQATSESHTIGGHAHPIVKLRERGFATRLPVFHLGVHATVLPAFTAFSGGSEVRTAAGDRLFACADDRIVELPARAFG